MQNEEENGRLLVRVVKLEAAVEELRRYTRMNRAILVGSDEEEAGGLKKAVGTLKTLNLITISMLGIEGLKQIWPLIAKLF